MTPAAPAADHVRLTSVTDGREHRVSDARYACAVTGGNRELVAACGRPVVMAALATPAGEPCRECVQTESASLAGAAGSVRRMLGRFRPTSDRTA